MKTEIPFNLSRKNFTALLVDLKFLEPTETITQWKIENDCFSFTVNTDNVVASIKSFTHE